MKKAIIGMGVILVFIIAMVLTVGVKESGEVIKHAVRNALKEENSLE